MDDRETECGLDDVQDWDYRYSRAWKEVETFIKLRCLTRTYKEKVILSLIKVPVV